MKTELRKIRGMQSLRSGGQGILGDSWWRAGLALQARGAQMSSINETTALVLCARSGGGNREIGKESKITGMMEWDIFEEKLTFY